MWHTGMTIECEGWRRHSSLILLILLFAKPNIELSGWLYQTKTHFTHTVLSTYFKSVASILHTLWVWLTDWETWSDLRLLLADSKVNKLIILSQVWLVFCFILVCFYYYITILRFLDSVDTFETLWIHLLQGYFGEN